MLYTIRGFFFAAAIMLFVQTQPIPGLVVFGVLGLGVLNIVKEKYVYASWLVVFEALFVLILSSQHVAFLLFLGMVSLDFTRLGLSIPLVAVVFFALTQVPSQLLLPVAVLTGLCAIFGRILAETEEQLRRLRKANDEEREERYNLETARDELLRAGEERTAFAELRERNRIAGQIHDNLGHALSSIYLQSQAAEKLFDVNPPKAKHLVGQTVVRLRSAIDLLRTTVHNLQTREEVGLEQLQAVIDQYQYCPVDFCITGDWDLVPGAFREIVLALLKEALTNATKHSRATNIIIRIDVSPGYIRVFIKDNGVGAASYKEGLGLYGMRQRAARFGGNLSIGSKDGFVIVCFLPMGEGGIVGADRDR